MRILTIIVLNILLIACSKNAYSVMDAEQAKLLVASTETNTPASVVVAVPSSDSTASSKADDQLEIFGVYIDSTSFPKLSPEIILYKQGDKLGGTYSHGFPNSENKKGFLLGPSPLENIRLTPNGDLSFSMPWDMGNQQMGFEKKHDYFTGRLHNDIIQGSFTSDWQSLTPPPIKASKKTSADLKQDILEYVLKKKNSASGNIQILDGILNCQDRRNQLPNETFEVIGQWLKVETNGGQESGYDLIVFKLGNELHGWLEDFSEPYGDFGTRHLISDIQLSKEKLHFKTQNGVEYKAIVKNSQLALHSYGEVMHLNKQKLPAADWVWKQYQAINVKCGFEHW